jgi:RNA polymerase sigma-70 factor (ECF subfamily)
VTWLQPYPDLLLDQLPDPREAPDARIERAEAVSLAFVTTLQLLSPRARAVLVLRDVLGFSAAEVAETLHSTPQAVAMTLSRARAAVRRHGPAPATMWGTAAEIRLVRLLT